MIAIVRPRVSSRCSPSASRLAWPRRIDSSWAWSATSVSKVVSTERDFATRVVSTRRLVVQVRAAVQVVPVALAEALLQLRDGRVLQRAERRVAHLGQPRRGLGADARDDPRRAIGDVRGALLAADGDEAGGLAEVGGDLGDEPVGRDRRPRSGCRSAP